MQDLLQFTKKQGFEEFDSLRIKLASPDEIRSWSYGEVKARDYQLQNLQTREEGLFVPRFLVLLKTTSVCVVSTSA